MIILTGSSFFLCSSTWELPKELESDYREAKLVGDPWETQSLKTAGILQFIKQIDVHYSLPRGDEQNQECDRDKNQVIHD